MIFCGIVYIKVPQFNPKGDNMTNVKVKGMHCPSCEMLIKDSMEDEGAKNIEIDHKTGNLSFESMKKEKAIDIVKKEGYEVI